LPVFGQLTETVAAAEEFGGTHSPRTGGIFSKMSSEIPKVLGGQALG
jgi:hypothetical protein